MIDQTVLGSKGKAKDALIGVPSATHWADTWDDPHWQAFVKAYKDAWPAEKRFPTPSFCAVNYYDETTAALLALDKVNGDLSDGHKKFRQALASLVLDAPNGQKAQRQSPGDRNGLCHRSCQGPAWRSGQQGGQGHTQRAAAAWVLQGGLRQNRPARARSASMQEGLRLAATQAAKALGRAVRGRSLMGCFCLAASRHSIKT